MCRTQGVWVLLALYVGSAHCFSWDIVLGSQNGLHFYKNGTLTHSEHIPSTYIYAATYDPVHNRVLFFDYSHPPVISSFDIATKETEVLVSCKLANEYLKFAYDPVTEQLFYIQLRSIYSFSLKPGSNNPGYGKLLIPNYEMPWGIAVDSCGGYIYWSTSINIERARFDGSEREVLINSTIWIRTDLFIEQQTQKMYWVDRKFKYFTIESADLNGKNRKVLFNYNKRTPSFHGSLTVTKDFIYWRGLNEDTYWQIPKNPPHDRDVEFKRNPITNTGYSYYCGSIAANYEIEGTQGLRNCEALQRLLPSNHSSVPADVSLICVHGTKAIEDSVCTCTEGYTGDRCDVSVCQNYCFQGDCSVTDEGQPICRCNAGHSGERCEVYACHKHCLNDGVCSLNADGEPVCHCTGDYNGERCEVSVSVFFIKCFRIAPTLSTLRDILDTDVAPVTLDKQVLQLMSESSDACFLNEP